eukprot:gene17181-biopygen4893
MCSLQNTPHTRGSDIEFRSMFDISLSLRAEPIIETVQAGRQMFIIDVSSVSVTGRRRLLCHQQRNKRIHTLRVWTDCVLTWYTIFASRRWGTSTLSSIGAVSVLSDRPQKWPLKRRPFLRPDREHKIKSIRIGQEAIQIFRDKLTQEYCVGVRLLKRAQSEA